jgi:hypothetical protein
MKENWQSQFANDPRKDYELYLELLDDTQPQAKIERAADGELYLSVFGSPDVLIPFRWLLSLADRAEELPMPGETELK